MPALSLSVSATLLAMWLLSPLASILSAAATERSPRVAPTLHRAVSAHPLSSPLFRPVSIPRPAVPPPLASAWSANSSSFNESASMRLLVHSSAAYTAAPSRCLARHYPSFRVTDSFNASLFGTALFGYAGVDEPHRALVFSFQGSMDVAQLWQELLHDQPVNATSGSGLLVNQYFYLASTGLLPAVSAAYRNLTAQHSNYTVYFTGHSLGGALAHVLSYLILSSPGPPSAQPVSLSLYTFGQPRTGNAAFAAVSSLYVPAHYRVVHWRDIIPHLPPCPTQRGSGGVELCSAANHTAGYYAYHAPEELWYQSAMPQLVTDRPQPAHPQAPPPAWTACTGLPTGEDEQCSDGLDWYWISDHYYYYGVRVGEFCLPAASRWQRHSSAAAEAAPVAVE